MPRTFWIAMFPSPARARAAVAARTACVALLAFAFVVPRDGAAVPPEPADVPVSCTSHCTATFEGSLPAAEPDPSDPLARPRWTPVFEVEPGDVLCILATGVYVPGFVGAFLRAAVSEAGTFELSINDASAVGDPPGRRGDAGSPVDRRDARIRLV